MFGIKKKIVMNGLTKIEKRIDKYKKQVDKLKVSNEKKVELIRKKYIETLNEMEKFFEWDLDYDKMSLQDLDEAVEQAIKLLKKKVGER